MTKIDVAETVQANIAGYLERQAKADAAHLVRQLNPYWLVVVLPPAIMEQATTQPETSSTPGEYHEQSQP